MPRKKVKSVNKGDLDPNKIRKGEKLNYSCWLNVQIDH